MKRLVSPEEEPFIHLMLAVRWADYVSDQRSSAFCVHLGANSLLHCSNAVHPLSALVYFSIP
jgi:hypothetical protein